MRLFPIAAAALVAVTLSSAAAGEDGGEMSGADGWADILRIELERGNPLPHLSELVPGFTLEEAYAVQRAWVDQVRRERPIGGYKAAFTGPDARRRFALEQPVTGVLFAAGARGDGARLVLADYRRLMVEIEIGFVLRSPIRRPMHSVADLRTYIREVVPAVELPDLDYTDPEALGALDLVATNLGAAAYLLGPPLALPDLAAVNTLEVALYRDGEVVDRGRADRAMGDQLAALLWLVNTLHAAGWPLEAGHVLLTGTLGRINPGVPGAYRAEYGERARVSFELVERP